MIRSEEFGGKQSHENGPRSTHLEEDFGCPTTVVRLYVNIPEAVLVLDLPVGVVGLDPTLALTGVCR